MVKLNDSERCRYIKVFAPLFLSLFLTCCSNDDATPDKQDSRNDNANTVLSLPLYTEATTPAAVRAEAVHGLEIPSLSSGTANAFIVHTLPDGTLKQGSTLVNYCVGYDTRLRTNCWTAFKWYNGFSSNDYGWNRNRWRQGETFNGYGGYGDPFQPDPVLPEEVRIAQGDYASSGYQRGHMLGSADRLNSKEANGQTFYMSNMHPQMGGFNEQGIWWNLENFLRDTYDTSSFRDTLYVVKGGTISEGNYRLVGSSGSLVCPKYFYMAILAYAKKYAKTDGGYFAIAFWMEHKANTDAVSAKYAITVDELEQLTGIDFFCNLPDDIEEAVESRFYAADWKLK